METPYALFRFNGEEVRMTQAQFEQAVRDARLCKCGRCLCCRAAEYLRESRANLED